MAVNRYKPHVCIIPEDDVHELEAMGVAKIFTPGATTASIVDWVVTKVGSPA